MYKKQKLQDLILYFKILFDLDLKNKYEVQKDKIKLFLQDNTTANINFL